MRLYNHRIGGDLRKLVTYTRDISLISEEEYEMLAPPSTIEKFPYGLANDALEYSGIFEDGWISENSFFVLQQPKLQCNLTLKGMLPKIESSFTGTTLTILIDGKSIFSQIIAPGGFNISVPVTATSIGRKKVELHFSNYQHLPRGDKRPIAAQMQFIGFG